MRQNTLADIESRYQAYEIMKRPNYFFDDVYVSSGRVAISVNGAENNDRITGEVTLNIKLASNFGDEILQTVLK